jgi:hypothetical protein
MWGYGAEAELTVDYFAPPTVGVSRADAPGTYSSRWAGPDGYFRAHYEGSISGMSVSGPVYFNGDQKHPGTWSAETNESLCQTAKGCPLTIPQLLKLGSIAMKAQQPEVAYASFKMASQQGNADAKASVGAMLIRGSGTEQDASQGVRLLQESANAGSYIGQSTLATFYETGIGVPKNLDEAKRWHAQADLTRQHAEAEENAKAATGTFAIGAAVVLGLLLLGAIAGDGSGADASDSRQAVKARDPYSNLKRLCKEGIQSACDQINEKNPKAEDDH